MIKSYTIILALLLVSGKISLFAQSESAQQYLEDMQAMSSTLYATQQYSLELRVIASQTVDPATDINTEPELILIQRDGNLSKVEREGSVVIREGNVVILIDDENKTIASVEDTTNFASINLGIYKIMLDSYSDQIRISHATSKRREYQIKSDKGEIKFLEAEFDIETGIFIRSYVELRNSPIGVNTVEVVSSFRQNPTNVSIQRNLYLTPVNMDTVRIAPAYQDYTYLSRRNPTARPVVLGGA